MYPKANCQVTKKAVTIQKKEFGGVFERIKIAIDFYGVTAKDLLEKNHVSMIVARKSKGEIKTKIRADDAKKLIRKA